MFAIISDLLLEFLVDVSRPLLEFGVYVSYPCWSLSLFAQLTGVVYYKKRKTSV